MDELCDKLLSCHIEKKPKLYDMMIFDFIELSKQYSSQTNFYIFEMNPKYEDVSFININELCEYIQKNNCENILLDIIHKRYPGIYADSRTVTSMIDYYLEVLMLCKI